MASSGRVAYNNLMNPFEFTTELTPEPVLPIPQEIAEQLPKSGRAKVIVVLMPAAKDEAADAEWRAGAYEQFLRDDSPDDVVYDNYSSKSPTDAPSHVSRALMPPSGGGSGSTAGNSSVNELPWPSWLSTWICPPCSLRIF